MFRWRRKRRGRDWYRNVYLRSDHWHAVRQWALLVDRHRCRECGRGGRGITLDVHHRTYEHLWAERPEDLETLCRQCHREKGSQ